MLTMRHSHRMLGGPFMEQGQRSHYPSSAGANSLSVSFRDVEDARRRLAPPVLRTPLIPLSVEDTSKDIFLKLEVLQPTGSFKVRGAGNAIALLSPEQRKQGVYTVSAGNMAQALAWHAHRQGIPCTAIVPLDAPETKLAGVRRFGADVIQLPWEEAMEVVTTHVYPPLKDRIFIHPFSNAAMIAGNGTIGLEILDDLPDVESVVVPFGGGGLAAGIATAIKALRPQTRVYGCEPETAAPLASSFAAGSAQHVTWGHSFVDGAGLSEVFPEIWTLVRPLLSGSIVVPLRDVANAIRQLFERHRIVVEGAGGISVAAALSGKAGTGRTVCIVSGGNIDPTKLQKILHGEVP